MSNNVWRYFWGTSYVKAPHNNGVSRFVQQLQRITIKFCKHKGTSKGTRDFIEKELIHYARANPGVVVYLKPRRHRAPVIKAEYLNGGTEYLSLHNRSCDEVVRWVDHYTTRSGQPTQMVLSKWHTDHLSVQGSWTPFTHAHPDSATRTYPHEDASAAEKREITATDQLVEIMKAKSM